MSEKKVFRIEAYDISHLGGLQTSGAMGVSENGIVNSRESRSFMVKGIKNDDPKALAQILERRFAKKEWEMPNLVVLDGGMLQMRACEDKIPKNIPVIAMEKSGDHGNAAEERFLSREGEILEFSDYAKNILRAVRDEAHRKANNLRKRRDKSEKLRTRLDDVSGVGPVAKKKLIARFGTPNAVMRASGEELASVVGEKLAEKILTL